MTHTGEKPFACQICDYRLWSTSIEFFVGHIPSYIPADIYRFGPFGLVQKRSGPVFVRSSS